MKKKSLYITKTYYNFEVYIRTHQLTYHIYTNTTRVSTDAFVSTSFPAPASRTATMGTSLPTWSYYRHSAFSHPWLKKVYSPRMLWYWRYHNQDIMNLQWNFFHGCEQQDWNLMLPHEVHNWWTCQTRARIWSLETVCWWCVIALPTFKEEE